MVTVYASSQLENSYRSSPGNSVGYRLSAIEEILHMRHVRVMVVGLKQAIKASCGGAFSAWQSLLAALLI